MMRRKFFYAKTCIFAAAWFLIALLFLGTSNVPSTDNISNVGVKWRADAIFGDVFIPGSNVTQPVLERPDHDRLRFLDAMKRDAEEEEQMRVADAKERKRLEEERIRRIRDRAVPPFKDLIQGKSAKNSLGKGGDVLIERLIQEGLIVPRWELAKEVPLNSSTPGENGAGLETQKEQLSIIDAKKFDDGWQRNAFNQYASDLMSLHRSLPDVRDQECKKIKYRSNLPEASVIIIFHNEAWSALLRTVHSVLDRSPPHLIREIILVDDFSDLPHLKEPLEEYVSKLGKVKIMRGKKREGLIRARLVGASVAMAPVLIFLDSHCECTMGWLEPILDRIAENKSNVVAPIIDVLDDKSLKYQWTSAKSTSIGGFDWNLQFNWHQIPQREKDRRRSPVAPVQSPTMAGGLFGISKEYFEYLGTYDPGMDIWGGENLELSFRVWMCGGTLEQVLCSHVGHIFRHRSPYAWRTGTNVVKKNSIRLAEVWMDDYKKYYYERLGNDLIWMCGGSLEQILCSHVGHIFRKRSPYKWQTGVDVIKKNSVRLAEVWMDEYKKFYYEKLNFKLGDYGDVSSRVELRKKLNCKSFEWYLKNIFPELFVPGDAIASGEIKNKLQGKFNGNLNSACIDSAVDKTSYNKAVKLWPCHNQGGNQFWMLSNSGEIRRDEGCIDYAGEYAMIYPCHSMRGNQEWSYNVDNTIRHINTNKCLGLSEDLTKIDVGPCTGIDGQIWYWRRKSVNGTSFPTQLHTLR